MSSPYHNAPSFYPRPGENPTRRPSYAAIAGTSNPSRPETDGAGSAFPHFRHNLLAENAPRFDAAMPADEPWKTRRRWSGDVLRVEDGGGSAEKEPHAFLTPSYLRGSRHVQRLRGRWEAHVKELRESARGTVAAGTGVQKQVGGFGKGASPNVHRGVAQEIIERMPPGGQKGDADGTHPLPTRWNDQDRMPGLEILGDGSEVRFSGMTKSSDEAASIRTDYPMPKECGIYYFEVTIVSRLKDGLIGIGFSSKKTILNRLPGWETESWAYHGDDGYCFACSATGKAYGPRFSTQDVIGCGVNFRTGEAFFTKNGIYLNTAFTGIKAENLYPSIGIKKPGEHLRANFGRQPFVFDIDGMMARERNNILSDLNAADVTSLHPPDDENALIHKLIGQYLAHEGYVETSRAFAADLRERTAALDPKVSDPEELRREGDDADDVHAIHRQKIRKSILEGDIDRALKYMGSYYPRVLQDERNRDIYFRLRCRKFIEMIARNSEAKVDETETQMEVDSQLQREDPSPEVGGEEDVEMATSTASLKGGAGGKEQDLMPAIIAYGQELQAEFGNDPRPAVRKELNDYFAVLAYSDPRESPVGVLLAARGRVGIAEGVNGAVLVSLGKPSSAALEKVCAQTEAFLDAAAAKTGGASGFVNVRGDFLKP